MMPIKSKFQAFTCLSFLCGALSAQPTPEQIAFQLSTRYIPYADAASVLNLELLSGHPVDAWWSTPESIRNSRNGYAVSLRKELAEGAHQAHLIGQPARVRSRKSRSLFNKPLSGLHLALDPGHIGGVWAEWEGRHFRIAEGDHWVREGELVLEVAQRVRTQLEALGAEVTLLRESTDPLNPKSPADYWALAEEGLDPPAELTLAAQLDYALAVRKRAVKMAIVSGELAERARLVNEVIRPDALISLHINAARWPEGERRLVESDHAHVLVFGCLSPAELAEPLQQERLRTKLTNGSGAVEARLGAALGRALAESTGLPASEYEGDNAIRFDPNSPQLWARNLMLLRLVDCPTVLLEPYIANSRITYTRIQEALAARAASVPIAQDDILIEYADAVVEGVWQVYGAEYSRSVP